MHLIRNIIYSTAILLFGALLYSCNPKPLPMQQANRESMDSFFDNYAMEEGEHGLDENAVVEVMLFEFGTDDEMYNNTLKELLESERANTYIERDSCEGDCCSAYRRLMDSTSGRILYTFKHNCGDYGYGNDEFVFGSGDKLILARSFSVSVAEANGGKDKGQWVGNEKLYHFRDDGSVAIMQRSKQCYDIYNCDMSDVNFIESADSAEKISPILQTAFDQLIKEKQVAEKQ